MPGTPGQNCQVGGQVNECLGLPTQSPVGTYLLVLLIATSAGSLLHYRRKEM